MRLVASGGLIDPSKPLVTILSSMGIVVSFGLIMPSRRAQLRPFICSLTSLRDPDAAAANDRFGSIADISQSLLVSALPPKADIGRTLDVRLAPKAEIDEWASISAARPISICRLALERVGLQYHSLRQILNGTKSASPGSGLPLDIARSLAVA
jgi:hypothetical protein